ncbi:MAG: sigma-70 family polymerase sigma factor [Ferruginibacter sp.]|nr:sigma-70 family polymerase sigma factor [Ferruginibacter sp.]
MNIIEQEQALLKGLLQNDKNSVELIYRENYKSIQSFVLNNNGSVDDARDIFQEAMIVLYEKSGQASFALNCQIKTYLYSICRRLWLKRLQQLGKFSTQVESLEDTIPVDEEIEDHDKKNDDFILMEHAMAKIGEPCKSLLDAYYLQKKNMQEIATEFGYTNADNAKTQKYKCLVRLKKLFFAQYKNI